MSKAFPPPRPRIQRFHYSHADLGPTEIMVLEDGVVGGLIDWDFVGHDPPFWIATNPSVLLGLDLCPAPPGCQESDWSKGLKSEFGIHSS